MEKGGWGQQILEYCCQLLLLTIGTRTSLAQVNCLCAAASPVDVCQVSIIALIHAPSVLACQLIKSCPTGLNRLLSLPPNNFTHEVVRKRHYIFDK